MNIFAKTDVVTPIVHKHGEAIYDLLSREQGKSEIHSVAIATIAVGKASLMHYHPVAEESYYILNGRAKMLLDNEESELTAGQIVLIPPGARHKIYNTGDQELEFLVVCVPAWEPGNTVFVESAFDGALRSTDTAPLTGPEFE